MECRKERVRISASSVSSKNIIVALKCKSSMLWMDAQIQKSATWPNDNSGKTECLEHINGNLIDSEL
jgi:hypothetical protein